MSNGKKRGPKGERFDDGEALLAMVPLVRKGMSELSAARHVVLQGLAVIKQNEAATIERVRRKFRHARDKLINRRLRSGPVCPTVDSTLKNPLATPCDLLGGLNWADHLEPFHIKALIEVTNYCGIASNGGALAFLRITEQALAAAARLNPVDLRLLGTEMNRALATEDALRAAGFPSQLAGEILSKARDKL